MPLKLYLLHHKRICKFTPACNYSITTTAIYIQSTTKIIAIMRKTFATKNSLRKINFLFSLLSVAFIHPYAQSIVTIPVETEKNVLLLQTDKDNRLGIIYFGKRLGNTNEYANVQQQYNLKDDNAGIYNSAYTSAGSWNLTEPALQLTHADGNTSLELKYVSNETKQVDANTMLTSILLKDPVYATEVTLYYKTYFKENVVEQWTVIKNLEKKTIKLEKYASANLYFMAHDYFLTHYNGGWGREMNPEEDQLTHGIKSIDSKLGTRANLFEPPTFMVSFDKPATEDAGKVLFGQLAWSGNFKIDFEVDSYKNLRLIAGINPYASEYTLHMESRTYRT